MGTAYQKDEMTSGRICGTGWTDTSSLAGLQVGVAFVDVARQTKVGHFADFGGGHEDVAGGQVAVHQLPSICNGIRLPNDRLQRLTFMSLR